jgi:NSS family neurotransmitter:Na+ symporter
MLSYTVAHAYPGGVEGFAMQPKAVTAAWSSRLAFILAAVGAAVGLGNIWKFPYVVGVSGGGAFVLIYLLAVGLVAVPILMAEVLVGRRGRHSPPIAIASVAAESNVSRRWALTGWFGLFSAVMILSFYSVIAGWAIAYVFDTAGGTLAGLDGAGVSAHFDALLASPVRLAAWHGAFMAFTVFISAWGLQQGVERAVTILMPLLFLMLLVMIGYSVVEGDLAAGLRFLFAPDFSKITGGVVLVAVGQAFFSISVGMGLMMAYGAYLPKEVSITRSALVIAAADTGVAMLAGIAIFPIVFANGLDPGEGPGLIFVTLPIAFAQMPGGTLFGTIFFLLLSFAAVTSAIAVLEPIVAWVQEYYMVRRWRIAVAVGIGSWVLGLGTVFSFNIWSQWRPVAFLGILVDKNFFDLLDYATVNLLIPLGGLLLSVFVGWRMSRSAVLTELGLRDGPGFRFWLFLLRVVAPVAILGIFITNLT